MELFLASNQERLAIAYWHEGHEQMKQGFKSTRNVYPDLIVIADEVSKMIRQDSMIVEEKKYTWSDRAFISCFYGVVNVVGW